MELVAGVAISPLLSGQLQVVDAQESKTKKVLLVAVEKPIQVSPDNALHPGGYGTMRIDSTVQFQAQLSQLTRVTHWKLH